MGWSLLLSVWLLLLLVSSSLVFWLSDKVIRRRPCEGCRCDKAILGSREVVLPPSSGRVTPGSLAVEKAPVTPLQTLFGFMSLASFLRSLFSLRLASRFACLLSLSSIFSSSLAKAPPEPAPTHHHHPKKLCQRTTAHIRPGNQTNSSSLWT